MSTTLHTSDLALPLCHRGKVRDLYTLPDDRLLMVATDRLSAFDVVLPDPIPGKGEMLCRISNFWFGHTAHLVPNHLTGIEVAGVLPAGSDSALYSQRAVVVRALRPLPIEAIVRSHLAGSGWKDYQRDGRIAGIPLPAGLRQSEALPEPMFTPSSKAAPGGHDQTIDFDTLVARIGGALAEQVRACTLLLYRHAAAHALARGILVADTKFEFGQDDEGRLRVMDEMLTPDSSRFWPIEHYRVGTNPPSYDKQPIRDHLEAIGWDKRPPGPRLPAAVIEATRVRYAEALRRLADLEVD